MGAEWLKLCEQAMRAVVCLSFSPSRGKEGPEAFTAFCIVVAGRPFLASASHCFKRLKSRWESDPEGRLIIGCSEGNVYQSIFWGDFEPIDFPRVAAESDPDILQLEPNEKGDCAERLHDFALVELKQDTQYQYLLNKGLEPLKEESIVFSMGDESEYDDVKADVAAHNSVCVMIGYPTESWSPDGRYLRNLLHAESLDGLSGIAPESPLYWLARSNEDIKNTDGMSGGPVVLLCSRGVLLLGVVARSHGGQTTRSVGVISTEFHLTLLKNVLEESQAIPMRA